MQILSWLNHAFRGRWLITLTVSLLLSPLVQGAAYRQVVIDTFGAAEVMHIVERAQLPVPGPGEVRIKVLAASVSFTDTMVRKGIYPGVGEGQLPLSPGYDLVGVIDALGEGVTGFTVGQRVADLSIWGAYTEYAIRPSEYLVPVPASVDPAAAVSLVLSYTTAYQMLHRLTTLEAGQSVLIHGASGAVGMALAQLAKDRGLTLYGTASTAKQDFVASLGVIPIDYKTEDFVARVMNATDQRGVDAVFDAVGVDNFERSFKVLKPGGTLITYGFYSSSLNAAAGDSMVMEFLRWQWLQLRWNWLPSEGRSAQFYSISDLREQHPEWFREDLATLFSLLMEQKIAPQIWRRWALDEVVAAHLLLEAGKVRGKMVLELDE